MRGKQTNTIDIIFFGGFSRAQQHKKNRGTVPCTSHSIRVQALCIRPSQSTIPILIWNFVYERVSESRLHQIYSYQMCVYFVGCLLMAKAFSANWHLILILIDLP